MVGIVLVLVRGLRGVANPWSRDLPSVGQLSAWRSGGGLMGCQQAPIVLVRSARANALGPALGPAAVGIRSGTALSAQGAAVVRHTNGGFLTSQRAPSLGVWFVVQEYGSALVRASVRLSLLCSAQPRGRRVGGRTGGKSTAKSTWALKLGGR